MKRLVKGAVIGLLFGVALSFLNIALLGKVGEYTGILDIMEIREGVESILIGGIFITLYSALIGIFVALIIEIIIGRVEGMRKRNSMGISSLPEIDEMKDKSSDKPTSYIPLFEYKLR